MKPLPLEIEKLQAAMRATKWCVQCWREPKVKPTMRCAVCGEKLRRAAIKHYRSKGAKPWQPGLPGRPPLSSHE